MCIFEALRGNLNSAPVLWTGPQNVTVDAKFDLGYDVPHESACSKNAMCLRTCCNPSQMKQIAVVMNLKLNIICSY